MKYLSRPIELTTARLSLREMNLAHAEYWFDFYSKEQIRRFLPDRFASQAEMRDALTWLIANYTMPIPEIIRITLAVHLKERDELPIGWVSYGPLPEDESKRELAYAIHPDRIGHGIATEAGARFLAWTDGVFAAPLIYASVDPENRASLRVAQKLGFESFEAATAFGEPKEAPLGGGDVHKPTGDAKRAHLVQVRQLCHETGRHPERSAQDNA